jgi:hypothetical protein
MPAVNKACIYGISVARTKCKRFSQLRPVDVSTVYISTILTGISLLTQLAEYYFSDESVSIQQIPLSSYSKLPFILLQKGM